MGWHGPQQCDDNCCDLTIPSPCTKPIVTCRRTGGPHGAEKFFYTIENADEAFVEETCRTPYGGTTSVQHPITLTNGDATGEYYTQPNCDYCIIARNECGNSLCCDKCTTPSCSIAAVASSGGFPAINSDGSITFRWVYSGDLFNDPVSFAEINGVSVLGRPFFETGIITIAKVDLPVDSTLQFVVRTDCGKQSICEIQLPCCFNKTQLRLSITGVADFVKSCSATNVVSGFNTLNSYLRTTSSSGFSALNGTFLFDNEVQHGRCLLPNFMNPGFSANRKNLGTVTITEERHQTLTQLNSFGPGFQTNTTSTVLIVPYTAYWDRLGLSLQPNAATATLTQTYNGVTITTTVQTLGRASFALDAYDWIFAPCPAVWNPNGEATNPWSSTADAYVASVIQYRITGFASNFSIPLIPDAVPISCPQLEFLNMNSRVIINYETEWL